MARELTASQRALQILAEIEMEEKLKQDSSQEKRSSLEYRAAEVKTAQNQPYQTGSDSDQPASFNLNKLTQNDIVNGFVLSELLNKPLALRPRRRF